MTALALFRAAVLALCLAPTVAGLPRQHEWFTPNATEMRQWLGQATEGPGHVRSGRPSCVRATDQDISDKLRLGYALTAACKRICDGSLDAWHLNPSGDEQVPEACVTQGELHFSGLEPSKGTKQVDQQETSNNLDTTVTQTVQLGGRDVTAVTASLTSTSSFSQDITIEVAIPEVMKVTSKAGFSFSSSSTSSQTDSTWRTFSNSVTATIQPHTTVCGKLNVDTLTYNSQFTADVCITGGFRCQYNSPCNGHYYWFGDLEMAGDTCFTLTGKAHANQDVKGHALINPGKCRSASADLLV